MPWVCGEIFKKETVSFVCRALEETESVFFSPSCFLLPASFLTVGCAQNGAREIKTSIRIFQMKKIWGQQKYLQSHFLFQKSGSDQFLFSFSPWKRVAGKKKKKTPNTQPRSQKFLTLQTESYPLFISNCSNFMAVCSESPTKWHQRCDCTEHTASSGSHLWRPAGLKVRTMRWEGVSLPGWPALLDDAPSRLGWDGGDSWEVPFQGRNQATLVPLWPWVGPHSPRS